MEGLVHGEAARGVEVSGVYRKRMRYFVDGLVIGSEAFIREHIGVLREKGEHLRRKHPIPHLESPHLSLREPRDTAVSF